MGEVLIASHMCRRMLTAVCLLGVALPACSSNSSAKPEDEATQVTACLDQPGKLERPPNVSLPCELIAPGIVLSK